MNIKEIEKQIRDVPDFPKKGIVFKDITMLLQHPEAFKATADLLYEQVKNIKVTKVVGIESRGFIFGAMLAERMAAGFVPVRKAGKLPYKTIRESYALEYGNDLLEMHSDAVGEGDLVLVHDDLLATGGTAQATCRMVERLGAKVAGVSFLVELAFLNGRQKLTSYPFFSLIKF